MSGRQESMKDQEEQAVLTAQGTLFVSITRLPERRLELRSSGMPKRTIHYLQTK